MLHSLSAKQPQTTDLEDYLRSKEGRPLWNNEDITLDNPNIQSGEDLASFVEKVTQVLSSSSSVLSSALEESKQERIDREKADHQEKKEKELKLTEQWADEGIQYIYPYSNVFFSST